MRSPAPLSRHRTYWLFCVTLLAVPIALAACSSGPPRVYAPLHYDYLTPLRLNVASVTVETRFIPGGGGDLNARNPAPLVTTLAAMAQDRLQAVGSSGRAVFVIKDASLVRVGDSINGTIDVELDVYGGGGTRAGFAEARVSRRRTGDDPDPQVLHDMTKQLMDAMNIEFEYQVRGSLRDWLAPTGAAPAPVLQQALPPPGSPTTPGASALPPPMPLPTLTPNTLQPPQTLSAPGSLPPPMPYPQAPSPYLSPPPTQLVPPRQP
jgi:hypothetical protein